jgi:hypothetical protein
VTFVSWVAKAPTLRSRVVQSCPRLTI